MFMFMTGKIETTSLVQTANLLAVVVKELANKHFVIDEKPYVY